MKNLCVNSSYTGKNGGKKTLIPSKLLIGAYLFYSGRPCHSLICFCLFVSAFLHQHQECWYVLYHDVLISKWLTFRVLLLLLLKATSGWNASSIQQYSGNRQTITIAKWFMTNHGSASNTTMLDVHNSSTTILDATPIQIDPSTTWTCRQCRDGRMCGNGLDIGRVGVVLDDVDKNFCQWPPYPQHKQGQQINQKQLQAKRKPPNARTMVISDSCDVFFHAVWSVSTAGCDKTIQ